MLEAVSSGQSELVESPLDNLCNRLSGSGFVHVKPGRMREHLATAMPYRHADLQQFSDSWHDLVVDPYMADGGTYRRRRHSVFAGARSGGEFALAPHRPHFQTVDNNTLNGGISRHFEPLQRETLGNPCFLSCLAFASSVFGKLQPFSDWEIEVHQFRIEALVGDGGHPTPEGVHQDGVNYVLMMLIARENVVDGETAITDLRGSRITQFTLSAPFEAALVDDTRVAHGVSPIMRLAPDRPGYRDMLVVTFKRV